MNNFDFKTLRECLALTSAVHIVDPFPETVKEAFMKEFDGEDVVYVTAVEFMEDIRKAIMENRRSEFYHKYTSPTYLFFSAENSLGNAAATAFITILCARKIDESPTVLVSRTPISEFNDALNMFIRTSGSLRTSDIE